MTFVISEEENAFKRMEMCPYHKELVRKKKKNSKEYSQNQCPSGMKYQDQAMAKLGKNKRNSASVSQRTLKEEMKVKDVTAARVLLKTIM